MKKLKNPLDVVVGDFVYVPASGFILEVTLNKSKAGKYTLLETVRMFIKYKLVNGGIYKFI